MWSRLLNAVLGVWLMAAPAVIEHTELASTNNRIVGPLITAFAIVAIWETTRNLRRANTVLGLWLLLAPLGYETGAALNSMVVGIMVVGASLVRGKMETQFGGGWMALWRPPQYELEPEKEEDDLMNHELVHETPKDENNQRRSEVVVITGASAGVGRATAAAFARRGAQIGLLARGEDGLEATRREVEDLGGQALALPTDVADPEQVEAAAAAVEKRFGPIDVWVNNAMVSVFSPIKDMTAEEFKRVTEVTYLGYVYGTLAALKQMLPRDRGVIIQVGSALAYRGIPLQAAYCGAKHAIEGFTDSLRVELLHDNSKVKVTIIQMPALNTPQFRWVKSRLPNQAQPVPPIFQPELAAEAIVWAAQHPRREVIVGGSALQAVLFDKFFPGLAGRYLARVGYQSQQTDQPRDPARPHNLWEPVPGDQGAHGAFDDRAKANSFQFWLAKHRRAVSALVAGLVGLFTAAFFANNR